MFCNGFGALAYCYAISNQLNLCELSGLAGLLLPGRHFISFSERSSDAGFVGNCLFLGSLPMPDPTLERLYSRNSFPLLTCLWAAPERLMSAMDAPKVEQQYRRLRFAAAVGSFLNDWMVVWGGWEKNHVFYLVLVERKDLRALFPRARRASASPSTAAPKRIA